MFQHDCSEFDQTEEESPEIMLVLVQSSIFRSRDNEVESNRDNNFLLLKTKGD